MVYEIKITKDHKDATINKEQIDKLIQGLNEFLGEDNKIIFEENYIPALV